MKVNPSACESVADIMQRVSHAELLSYYMGISELPVLISSPLRGGDSHPSFFIYSPDGNKVLYKDYATGDRGDIYSLLKAIKGVSFAALMREIAANKSFTDNKSQLVSNPSQGCSYTKVPTDLQVKIREWREYDIAYWQSYGISLQWLKYAEVYPISHKIVYKGTQRYVFPAAKYAYVFVERKEGIVSLKVYQPMVIDKRRKWHTSNNGSVVGLWTKVPQKGEKICICSSLKDALCLWANTGIPAIYVQSETTGMSDTAQKVLRNRFKHVFICFDNDAPGLKDAAEFARKTGFTNIILPAFEGGKDISDLYKSVGKEEFIRIVKPLFDI